MLSERYEPTEVECRTWRHVHLGTYGPPEATPRNKCSWNTKRNS